MRQGWESEARNWASFVRTPGSDLVHEDINLPAFAELLPKPVARTLDLGCGEGRLSRFLRDQGHQVAGADAAPTMVQLAATHPGAAPVVLADAARLPFADATFDLVVAYMCLQDIDDLARAVGEAGRVLAPGGHLCAAIPHPVSTAGYFQGGDGAAPFVISGSYLDPAPLTMTTERAGVRVTFHSEHRPLGAYAQALTDAGLLTETMREVKMPAEVVAREPDARRWWRVPLFLHLRAVRPAANC